MVFNGIIPCLKIFNNHFYQIFSMIPLVFVKMGIGFLYALIIACIIHFSGKHICLCAFYGGISLWFLKSIHAASIYWDKIHLFIGIKDREELFDIIFLLTNFYSLEFISFLFFFFITYITLRKYFSFT
jgi:hypothetical protein